MRPTVVTGANESWSFQQSYVERLMDHAALTSAHPDDTLILAGPARYGSGQIDGNSEQPLGDCLAVGMVQNINVTQTKPTQPLMAIGSGRVFFVSGKAQGTAAMARLFVNGRNLLRVLHTNAVQKGVQPNLFDDKAALAPGPDGVSQFFANLDSELFLVPFGLACLFRDKIHNILGAFYLELCMVNNWTINFSAGQNLILENVNILFDRLIPINMGTAGQKPSADYPDSGTIDSILGEGANPYPDLGSK